MHGLTPEDALACYQRALASHDWRQAAPWLHEDACCVFAEGTLHGKAAVCAAIRQTFEWIRSERYQVQNLHWTARGADFACCVYDFSWNGLIDGEPASGAGRGSCALIRDARGWRLLQEHLGPPAAS